MPKRGEYSEKYGFNISHLKFDCGGASLADHQRSGGLSIDDIAGAQPRRFTAERSAPHPAADESLESPHGRSRYRPSAEPRNPLEPDYKLPPVVLAPPEPTKFIRDAMDVSDIHGAHASPTAARASNRPANSLNTSDIDGCHTKPRPAARAAPAAASPAAVGSSSGLTPAENLSLGRRRAPEPPLVALVDDGVGKLLGTEWRQQRFEQLRRHGSDVVRARQEAQQTLGSLPAAGVAALEVELKAMDRDGSGILKPKEFEQAVQRGGLSMQQVKSASRALSAADSAGMVNAHYVLSNLYDKTGTEGSENAPAGQQPPSWYVARQRRLKTDVAAAMGQQPAALSAAGAAVVTPQESYESRKPNYGKRIDPQAKAEAEGGRGESYWFADTKGDVAGVEAGRAAIAGRSTAHGSDESAETMDPADWRPTKDPHA